MDGLEISEIKFSQAIGAANISRWDSEFYKKEFLCAKFLLERKETTPFYRLCNFIRKGIFDLSPSFYREQGVPFIRTSEIKSATIDFETTVFLDVSTNADNSKTILYPQDLVFTKIGAYIGDVAKLPDTYDLYNFSQNVAGASIKDKRLSSYLLTFFLSKIGRLQILRSAMLSGQGKLELEDIRNYKIPLLERAFMDEIAKICDSIANIEAQSLACYKQAESILINYLNIPNDIKNSFTVKTIFSSFKQSGRLDAEYYQPKYDTLFETLSQFTIINLGGENGLVSIKKSIEPGSEAYQDEGIPFVRVSDVNKYGIVEPNIKLSPTIVPNIESLYPRKDTILLSKDGSVGIAYKVQEDIQVVTSGALLHLTVKDTNQVLPDYLTLVLNSQVVQLQSERDCNGAIIQHWKPSDIEKVRIPVLDMDKQKEISDKVLESFSLRKEAKRLLDSAIKAVEMAIETDEESALLWLDLQ